MAKYLVLSYGIGNGSLFIRWSWGLALEYIAKKYGYKYIEHNQRQATDLIRVHDIIPEKNAEVLIFTSHSPAYGKPYFFECIKYYLPNIKVIIFGSDFGYFDIKAVTYKPNLVLETMRQVVTKGQSLGLKIRHYWWSISKQVIKAIQEHTNNPPKALDLFCLCNQGHSTPERNRFFSEIDKTGIVFWRNRKLYDLGKIIDLYKISWIVLGTTSPVLGGLRTMKGFRDWIAPFCNAVLIYDDYPDMLELSDLVPTYKYGDAQGVRSLACKLQCNKDLHQEYVAKQKEWALNHTIEDQFETILKEESIIS
jgi:hypothetical protein